MFLAPKEVAKVRVLVAGRGEEGHRRRLSLCVLCVHVCGLCQGTHEQLCVLCVHVCGLCLDMHPGMTAWDACLSVCVSMSHVSVHGVCRGVGWCCLGRHWYCAPTQVPLMESLFPAPFWEELYGRHLQGNLSLLGPNHSLPPAHLLPNASHGAFLPLGLQTTIVGLYLAVCVGGLLGNCLVMYVILR